MLQVQEEQQRLLEGKGMTNYIYLTQEEIRALLHIRGKLRELEELTNIIHAEDLLEESERVTLESAVNKLYAHLEDRYDY